LSDHAAHCLRPLFKPQGIFAPNRTWRLSRRRRSAALTGMVERRFLETLPDGRDVHCWRLESADGAGLTVMDLGATMLSLEVPDRRGHLADIVLGYGSAATCLSEPHYHGAVIGRFANRIAGARFTLDGHLRARRDPAAERIARPTARLR
jgi:hypothetical protein